MSSQDSSFFVLQGCRQNNLKGFSLRLPKQCCILVAGVSGAGKSSLAFDTLYVEGQHRYLECLSVQTRSAIQQHPRPDVDVVEGLAPTLSIGAHAAKLRARHTVAMAADLYTLLSLLYAQGAQVHSPITGEVLHRFSCFEMVEQIKSFHPSGSRLQILAPLSIQKNSTALFEQMEKLGFIRIRIDGEEFDLSEAENLPSSFSSAEVIVDRLTLQEDSSERLKDSLRTALQIAQGIVQIQEGREGPIQTLSEIYYCPSAGIRFSPPEAKDFSFLSPRGACPTCKGQGTFLHVDTPKVSCRTLDESLDLLALLPLSLLEESRKQWLHYAERHTLSFPGTFLEAQGSAWPGFSSLVETALQEQRRHCAPLLRQTWVQEGLCPSCEGLKIKKESLYFKIGGKSIADLCSLTVDEAYAHLKHEEWLPLHQDLLPPLFSRFKSLQKVGLGYLPLNQEASTLSQGEAQRLLLAAQSATQLSGVFYILDEPTRGLHWKDTTALLQSIQELKSLGNSLLIVEHSPQFFQMADWIVQLGPGAGRQGGEIVFQGTTSEYRSFFHRTQESFYPTPRKERKLSSSLCIGPLTQHYLQRVSFDLPLGGILSLCGTSGSGKSTLLWEGILPALRERYPSTQLALVEQKLAAPSARSTPASYMQILAPIRRLFADTRLAKARGYSPSYFSLMRKGGRCEACQGLGEIALQMDFLPDSYAPCEVCEGRCYQKEVLDVLWKGYSLADLFAMDVDQANELFSSVSTISSRLELLQHLGLGYLPLGQPMHTLSTGERQRLKLATELAKKKREETVYLLDEPSAGLHFHDCIKLSTLFHELVEKGHSVLLIEHNPYLLLQSDWIIEVGPGGGPYGGKILFEGTPGALRKKDTPTAEALRAFQKLSKEWGPPQ